MRTTLLLFALCCLAGCGGSKSKEAVELAIDNPKKKESPAQQLPDVETPENARKLLIQAAKLARQGLVGKSIEMLSHAISMNPDNSELYIARAEVYGMMREDASALADYSVAIRVKPNDASIHNRRGFFLLSRNEHTRALKDFSRAIELNSKSPQAYNNRGLVYLSIGQAERAVQDFAAAVKLDPRYADAWNNRGFARFRQKKYKEAIVDLTRAISEKPDYLNALNNRGLTYLAMKNYDLAIADFSTAIKVDPYELKLFRGRRAALIEQQRFEEAQADTARIEWLIGLAGLTQEIDREPLVYANYVRRGDYLAERDEHVAAIRDYSQAARLNNQNPEPLIRRARSLLALEEADKAIRDCDTAIELGDPPQAYSVRGDAWLRKGNHDRAIADFERAQRVDTAVADAYLLRAAALEQAGEKQRAEADRTRAAAIDPTRETP